MDEDGLAFSGKFDESSPQLADDSVAKDRKENHEIEVETERDGGTDTYVRDDHEKDRTTWKEGERDTMVQ